jgi:GTP-binding protein YchF
MNRAVVAIPDRRIEALASIYQPPKITPASLEVVDIAGLASGSTAGEGRGARLLAHLKDVDALLHVVRCFEDEAVPFTHATIDPARDVDTVDVEMMVADSQTLENKINRLAKKARTDSDVARQVADCQKVKDAFDQGIPARRQNLTLEDLASIRECNLISLKPVLYVANIKSMEDISNRHVKALWGIADAEGAEMVPVCGRDEAEISRLDPADQAEFLAALGLEESSMERLLRAANRRLGLVNFFTAGEKEVHVWTCQRGDKAPVAAGKIHSDMEEGFIRMEVIRCDDLIELGSEAAVAKAGRQRVEGRAYEVQDGDVVVVLFNPN